MSVTIRLAKIGKKFQPTYKVVVSHTRSKRTGEYLEVLGTFNPNVNPFAVNINTEKLTEWQKKGAKITEAVSKILDNKYTFKIYNPKAEKKAAEAAKKAAEAAAQTE
jgi:small subunit ribosomal protein S16